MSKAVPAPALASIMISGAGPAPGSTCTTLGKIEHAIRGELGRQPSKTSPEKPSAPLTCTLYCASWGGVIHCEDGLANNANPGELTEAITMADAKTSTERAQAIFP